MVDSTARFSDRVRDYVRYRPSYPAEVVDLILEATGLDRSAVIADVGSGTGISTRMFVEAGHEVYAVEPNDAMREAAERELNGRTAFHSVNGSAEKTTLRGESVDLVVAAQAFHWFDRAAARAEFGRILREPRHVALLWNARSTTASPFLQEYEELLQQFGTDYRQVDHLNIARADLSEFFASPVGTLSLPNQQTLDLPGLEGRLLSSSYTPAEGDRQRALMLEALRDLFDRHQRDDRVEIKYDCQVHLGTI